MTRVLAHRGPDAEGIWAKAEAGIGLGHRRLSIIELSDAGAQPMQSSSGRFIIVYNGEIYNHLELRRQLQDRGSAPEWRGSSDTETLLAMVECFGLAETLRRSYGMFAFALWDQQERKLMLARDRVGEKPLYYGWSGRDFLFASELRAFRVFPGFVATIDPQAVSGYLRYGYVTAPLSILKGIFKLPPGTWLSLPSDWTGQLPAPSAYWSPYEVVANNSGKRAQPRTEKDAADELEELLGDVIGSQLLSDVPIGVFLSGGIDSSLITAIMKRRSTGQVNSFSIGFEDDRFNEAPFAREVARHLGTNHTELTITARDSLAIVPQIASIYDEPLADSSQIPSIFLARMARSHVTVALTGDGGDEIFGGYNRYLFAPKFWRTLSRFPRTMRRRLATGFVKFEQSVRRAGYSSDGLFARFGLPTSMGDKIGFLAEVASNSNDISDVYCGLSSINPDVRAVLAQPIDDDGTSLWRSLDSLNLSDAERMILIDTLTYLPGDILTKVDRATMSASLESRAPLLDGRIIDFAWSLPLENKISGSVGKRILRRILARHVPTHLIDRPKQGFGIPLDDWLRSGLKEWASELLSPHSLDSSGLLNSGVVTGMWESHLSRRRNMGSQLWTILLLESWRRGLK